MPLVCKSSAAASWQTILGNVDVTSCKLDSATISISNANKVQQLCADDHAIVYKFDLTVILNYELIYTIGNYNFTHANWI